MPITIAIDARPLARGSGGIQRYLGRILPYLLANPDLSIILYTDRALELQSTELKFEMKVRSLSNSKISQFLWNFAATWWLYRDKPNLFWSPRHHLPLIIPSSCRSVITIHDFVWRTAPSTMPFAKLIAERILMPSAIRKSDEIICISGTTQNQLKCYYPDASQKSRTIFHGEDFGNIEDKQPGEKKNYFLAVGTLEPRKNYGTLIAAHDQYINEGGKRRLVIVGKRGWRYSDIFNQLVKMKNKEKITILEDVSDQELQLLYKEASAFVSVSIDEGYGLPPQEAQSYGLPILLSDIDVYRELYPDANLWTNAGNIQEIKKQLQQLQTLKSDSEAGTSKKPVSSWEESSSKHIELFTVLAN